jgi:hypothetical protein
MDDDDAIVFRRRSSKKIVPDRIARKPIRREVESIAHRVLAGVTRSRDTTADRRV